MFSSRFEKENRSSVYQKTIFGSKNYKDVDLEETLSNHTTLQKRKNKGNMPSKRHKDWIRVRFVSAEKG